jgi:protoporphyrinogen oxidase
MNEKKAIIIGGGPAGLTAAYELLQRTDIKPIIYESSDQVGGISKTINYKGNRIDIGGHRFFSKSDRVMDWWQQFLPIQGAPAKDQRILNIQYQNQMKEVEVNPDGPDPEETDLVLLIRKRLSRIYFLRKFFSYPVSLNLATFKNLGIIKIMRIGFGYLFARIFPIKNEQSLEDFFINRFGKELYLTFFKDYTEKVWGKKCHEIPAEWGAQRIKGLSLTETIIHAIKKIFKIESSISQKDTETTLIEQFLYPKYGPGQMWETVLGEIIEQGGEFHSKHLVKGLTTQDNIITGADIKNLETGEEINIKADYFFSTMPVKNLISGMKTDVPDDVRLVALGLEYRDFITVGLLLKNLKIENTTDWPTVNNTIPDNWIYIQEKDVRVERLQIFNNWSPYLVKDLNTVWLGMEYFCNEGDELWEKPDSDFIEFAIDELQKIDIINKSDVLDKIIVRVPKTYPAYFGTYNEFSIIREYVDKFSNLFLIGRNGMHKYNNQDHSMLTAMVAVDNISNNITSKENIWAVNTEEEYHENK